MKKIDVVFIAVALLLFLPFFISQNLYDAYTHTHYLQVQTLLHILPNL